MKWFFLFLSLSAGAGLDELPEKERYRYQRPRQIKRPLGPDAPLQRLMEEDRKIAQLLAKQARNVIVKKSPEKIMALSRFKGILLNSVIAMNIKPAKFIVKLSGGEWPGSELRCLGYSFERRVPSRCDLLRMGNEEYQVDVELWDLDGAEGIIADYYYSGEEKAFIHSSFVAFLQGLDNFGKKAPPKILNGINAIFNNAKTKIAESSEAKVQISYINSGREVLVFFNQSIHLKGVHK